MRSTQLTTILLIVPVLFLCSIFLMHHQQSLAENREIPIESTTIQSTTIDPKKEARDNCTNEKNAEWKNISLCVFENLVCEKAEVNLIDVCSKQGFGDFEEVCDCKEGFMRQFKGGKGDCVEQQECEQEQRKEKQCKDRQNTEWAKLDECMVIPTCNKQNPDLIPNCVKEPRMGCKCKANFFHQIANELSPCVSAAMCTELAELNKFVPPPSLEIEEDPDYYD